jgi:hypothetical protein
MGGGAMDEMRVENITYKPLSRFKKGTDTIYISKMHSGYQAIYFCNFISFEGGVVKAQVISSDIHGITRALEEITTRPNKCLLWGYGSGDTSTRCHWFQKIGKEWSINKEDSP